MFNTIIFDLSGVIITRINGIAKMVEPILKINSKEIHTKFKTSKFQDFLRGEITEEDYWKRIIDENNWEITVSKLKEISRKNFEEIKGTREIIEKLKTRNFKLGLLSSHTKEWAIFLNEKFNYEKYFDKVLYSYQIGIVKPNKELYLNLLNRLNAKPQECIYIDDKYKYVEPAQELGMVGIKFVSPSQLKTELTKLSVI